MKKRFRVFSALCCLLLAVSALSGCGGGGAGESSSAGNASTGKDYGDRPLVSGSEEVDPAKIGFEKRELENPNVKLFLPYEPTDAAKGQIAKYEEKYGGTCGFPAWPS